MSSSRNDNSNGGSYPSFNFNFFNTPSKSSHEEKDSLVFNNGDSSSSSVPTLTLASPINSNLPRPDFSGFDNSHSFSLESDLTNSPSTKSLPEVLSSPALIPEVTPSNDPRQRFKKFLKGNFNGNNGNDYREFETILNDYLGQLATKSKNAKTAEMNNIGDISNSPEHYFDPTPEVMNYAQEFFTAYWDDADNVEAIQQRQKDKFRETRANYPHCISFVAAESEIQGQEEEKYPASMAPLSPHRQVKLCFIAVSSWGSSENRDDWERLKSFVRAYNEETENLLTAETSASSSSSSSSSSRARTRFELLDMASPDFHELIAKALANLQEHKKNSGRATRKSSSDCKVVRYDPLKNCAEKGISAQLTKIYFERGREGKEFKARGMVSSFFYPYEPQQKKEKHLSPIKFAEEVPHVKFSHRGKIYFTPVLPCCNNCQINKPGVLSILAAAKAFGQAVHQAWASGLTSPPPAFVISPLQLKLTPKRTTEENTTPKPKARVFSNLSGVSLFQSPSSDDEAMNLSDANQTSASSSVSISSVRMEESPQKRIKTVYAKLLQVPPMTSTPLSLENTQLPSSSNHSFKMPSK